MREYELGDVEEFWICPPGWEYGWVTEREYFDDLDDPLTTVRQFWRLERRQEVIIHPRGELCNECGGDPEEFGGCGTCDDSGVHPCEGQVEVISDVGREVE